MSGKDTPRKRTASGMEKRRAKQREDYRAKYAANREKELARRRAIYNRDREFEKDRHKAYYDAGNGQNGASERIANEPSRGLIIANRRAKAGRLGLDAYTRLIGERVALANEITSAYGRPTNPKGKRRPSTTGVTVRPGNREPNKSKSRHARTSKE